MSWTITPGETLDPDAVYYIGRVEAADGQALEPAVVTALDAFVKGCKADGIWNAIKASCILAGARTLSGALVPLAGTAPTNFNFVAGDYSRKTGLAADGATKYLDSNRNANADPTNNYHAAVFPTTVATANADRVYIGASINLTGTTAIWIRAAGDAVIRFRSAAVTTGLTVPTANALIGATRSSSASYTYRRNSASESITNASDGAIDLNMFVFASSKWNLSTVGAFSNARLAFYSIGESLDLALLDARVTTLINAFSTAIP